MVVFSACRSQHDEKMTQFFKNNFSEDRWRKAALKNAFSLLGKQRFEQSAAFFLLAGSLKDAIEVRTIDTIHRHSFLLLSLLQHSISLKWTFGISLFNGNTIKSLKLCL